MDDKKANEKLLQAINDREEITAESDPAPSVLATSVLTALIDNTPAVDGVNRPTSYRETASRLIGQAASIKPILDPEATFPRLELDGDTGPYYNFDDLRCALRNNLIEAVKEWGQQGGPLNSIVARSARYALRSQYDGAVVLYLVRNVIDDWNAGQRKRFYEALFDQDDKDPETFVRVFRTLIKQGYTRELKTYRNGLDLDTMLDVALHALGNVETNAKSHVTILSDLIGFLRRRGSLNCTPDQLHKRAIEQGSFGSCQEEFVQALLNHDMTPSVDLVEGHRDEHERWFEMLNEQLSKRNKRAMGLLSQ